VDLTTTRTLKLKRHLNLHCVEKQVSCASALIPELKCRACAATVGYPVNSAAPPTGCFSDRASLSSAEYLGIWLCRTERLGAGHASLRSRPDPKVGAARIGQTERRATLLDALYSAADIYGFIRTIVYT